MSINLSDRNALSSFISENFSRTHFENPAFLEKLKSILVSELELQKFVQRIVPRDLSKLDVVSLFDYEQKAIYFDMFQIMDYLELLKKNGYLRVISSKSVAFKFFQAVTHEVVHACQDKCSLAIFNNEPFTEVLRHSILVHDGYLDLNLGTVPTMGSRIFGQKLYQKYHNLFPGERQAELMSYEYMIPIFENVCPNDFININDLRDIFYTLMCEYYRFGNNPTCPLEEFYNIIGASDFFNEFDFSSYNSHDKIICGMPLNFSEFKSETNKILVL